MGQRKPNVDCFLCVERRTDMGQPFECNNCLRWLPEESFNGNQRGFRSTHTRVCDKCLERRECINCKQLNLETAFAKEGGAETGIKHERGRCKECMDRSEKGIWQCNGCRQNIPRDTSFDTWLRGTKTDVKQPSARCSSCYDKDEQTTK